MRGGVVKHGHSPKGGSSPTYNTWRSMLSRTTNPKAPDFGRYGGRGVTVCDRWLEFVNFLADMGERPDGLTLDRIDNARGYEPGNCRWATRYEQQRNQRGSKLTLAMAIEAVRANRAGETCTSIAARFGVGRTAISHITAGDNWPEARGLA